MFNVGGGEVLVILLLAIIVLGPDKLPEAAKQAGKYLSEFRRMSNGFQQEIKDAMDLNPLTTKPKSATMTDAAPARPITPDAAVSAAPSIESIPVPPAHSETPPPAPSPGGSPGITVDGPSNSFD